MRKSFFSSFLSTLALCLCSFTLATAAINPKPFVVPELTSWTGSEGSISLSGRIVVKNSKFIEAARMFANDYRAMFGTPLTIVSSSPKKGDILFTLKKDAALGTEGYRLNISDKIEIIAATPRAAFWATRTILQIAEQNAAHTLPCGVAVDVPEYKLRGFTLDCGRKYIPATYLHKLVKIMAYYKMNTLQLHLNDNGFKHYFGNDWSKTQAAFRLECNTYPGLTATDGSYSKREFNDLQKQAEQLGVEIIPEIGVPAHSLAFSHYRAELGSKEYGMDHLDLSNPKVYDFFDALFREYLGGKDPVFRGKRVHIGTDEYSNAKQEVVEQFRAFTDHYIRFVESFGKQAALWGALTYADGTTPVKASGVLMNCWYNGFADPVEMKKLGYQIVSIPDGMVYIVPAAGYYNDYLNCENLYNVWTPAKVGNRQFEENDPAIEGGMFAVWNDHVGNGISTKDIHHRMFPALQTIAVKCWSGRHTSLPYDDFNKQRAYLSEAPGVNELARLGKSGETVLRLAEVFPADTLPAEEIGYDYAVSFTLEAKEEHNGTILFSSDNAIFYLSTPAGGQLGFARDGYLNNFNYRPEPGKKVDIRIEGTNKSTRLFVDNKLVQELAPRPLYVVRDTDRANFVQTETTPWNPLVYNPKSRIIYQSTLVFPLRRAGNFQSRVTNLQVIQK